MKGLLLDTHIWIWYLIGHKEINLSLRREIGNAIKNNTLYVSAISLWEVSMLESRGRIILEMPCLEWIKNAIDYTHAQIVPLSPEIAVESCHLPSSFHGDPADRLIVATARVEALTMVTKDQRILEYSKQKYISVLALKIT
jgi:PIN domain nuclease of toxin-antitoxin system